TAVGKKLPGLALADLHTVHGARRKIGNIVIETSDLGLQPATLVGFENHSGKTYLGPGLRPLGRVIRGAGNSGEDATEGAVAGASVILAYEYRYHLDRIPQVVGQPLAFGPYVAAIPVVVAIYLFSLAVNQQYRSWRGRTLVDQVFAMGSGTALAAMLTLAGMS